MAATNGRRTWPAALLFLGLMALAGSLESASQRTGLSEGYLVTSAAQGRNAALAQAGGEFRIVAANLLWSKAVDHYHHQYMATGGDWSKNESLLPLLQTIITLDPHFVQAYEIMGGTILPRTGHPQRGEEVLKEGIARNPNEWELYREMAMLLSYTERRPAEALPYADKGLAQANDDFSRHLMTKLTHTLADQVAEARRAKRPGAKSGKGTVKARTVAPSSVLNGGQRQGMKRLHPHLAHQGDVQGGGIPVERRQRSPV